MIKYLKNKFCLLTKINHLELEVHNSNKVIEVLQEELEVLKKELANSYDVLANKKIELSNLNSYTKKLENKINSIKQLVL